MDGGSAAIKEETVDSKAEGNGATQSVTSCAAPSPMRSGSKEAARDNRKNGNKNKLDSQGSSDRVACSSPRADCSWEGWVSARYCDLGGTERTGKCFPCNQLSSQCGPEKSHRWQRIMHLFFRKF